MDRVVIPGVSRTAGRPTAFTLIEVLVVVAIIALLVAILLPSLKMAREISRRSVCATQEHQIAIALTTYAQDHKGSMPYKYAYLSDKVKFPNLTDEQRDVGNNTLNNTYETYWFWASQGGGNYNLGFLWGKYIRDGHVFYCPSNRGFKFEDYNPFPDHSLDGTRASYTYNPWVKFSDTFMYPELSTLMANYPSRQDYERLYKRIDDPKLKGRILLLDMFTQGSTEESFAHKSGPGSVGWNAVTVDGSVRLLRNGTVAARIGDALAKNDPTRYMLYLDLLRQLNKGAY